MILYKLYKKNRWKQYWVKLQKDLLLRSSSVSKKKLNLTNNLKK